MSDATAASRKYDAQCVDESARLALTPIDELTAADIVRLCEEHVISGLESSIMNLVCAGAELSSCTTPSHILALLDLHCLLPDDYIECTRLYVVLQKLREFQLPSSAAASSTHSPSPVRSDLPDDTFTTLFTGHCGSLVASELQRHRVSSSMVLCMDPVLLSIRLIARPSPRSVLALQRALLSM